MIFLFRFYPRWKEAEQMQASEMNYTLDDQQWKNDWTSLVSLAATAGNSLEQAHVFALAHILRRPIIIYAVKYVKGFKGESIDLARFEGNTYFSPNVFRFVKECLNLLGMENVAKGVSTYTFFPRTLATLLYGVSAKV